MEQNGQDNIISKSSFVTPDMGDFVSKRTLLELGKLEMETSEEVKDHLYIDKPFSTKTGYHSDKNVIIFRAKVNALESNEETQKVNGNMDGDTVYLSIDTIADEGDSFQTVGSDHVFKSVKDYLIKTVNIEDKQLLNPGFSGSEKDVTVGFRFVGIDAPEIPKFRDIPLQRVLDQRVEISLEDILRNDKLTIKHNNLFGEDKKLGLISKEIPINHVNFLKVHMDETNSTKYQSRDITMKRVFVIEEAYDSYKNKTYLQANEIFIPNSNESSFAEYVSLSNPTSNFNGLTDNLRTVKMVTKCDGLLNDINYFDQGKRAQSLVLEKIKGAQDVLFMADCTVLNKTSGSVPPKYRSIGNKVGDNPMYALEAIWQQFTGTDKAYKYLGYSYFGQDAYKRLLGAIYIKTHQGLWINLAKLIAQECDRVELLPNFTSSSADIAEYGNVSDAFELWTYSRDKEFIDMVSSKDVDKCDDRARIQREITGVSLDNLKSHTVMIGDCLLMIPPTSIRTVSQTTSTRTSFIRTKGSLAKSTPKSERIIELTAFFNNETINGIPYKDKLPNGSEVIYHMNGLRALVAQFKFTPFLPISNEYINDVLNIEAVALQSFSVSTVPNLPRTLEVKIQLTEFNYSHYMPEITPPDPTIQQDLYTNMFSKTIHFPLLRYYYQRCIQRGEDLVDLDMNTQAYLDATIGQQTALQPMKFQKPTMKVYVANEEHLKMKKQVYLELQKRPLETTADFSKEEEVFLSKLITEYAKCANVLNNLPKLFECVTDKKPKKIQAEDVGMFTSDNNALMYETGLTTGSIYNRYFLGNVDYLNHTGLAPIFDIGGKSISKEVYDKVITGTKKSIRAMFSGDAAIDTSIISNVDFATHHVKESGGMLEKENVIIQWGLLISPNWGSLGVDIPNFLLKLKTLVAKEEEIDTNILLKDEKIFIAFSCKACGVTTRTLYPSTDFYLDKGTTPDLKLMSNIISKFGGINIDEGGIAVPEDMFNPSDEISDMQDNIELESSRSLKFDEYPIGFPIITSISSAYNNKFANLSLKAIDGYAPQFTGGTDSTVYIEMTTTDDFTVNQFQTLKRALVHRLITYRKVLASSPIRIDTEFTRFLGISEAIVDSIEINTVPNMPGTYNISLMIVSVDRTIRNKEALKKVDGVNNSETPNMSIGQRTSGYFDLEEALSKVNIYPDLELPTIQELSLAGFEFLSYKQKTERIYPDPDFYFVYLEVFAAELYRTAIVKYFENKELDTMVTEYNGDIAKDKVTACKNTKKLSGDIKGRGKYFSYATDRNQDAINIDEIYSAASFSYDEKVKEGFEQTNVLNEAINVKKVETALQEIMSAISTSSYDIFPTVRVSIKEPVPFGEATEGILGPGYINSYEIDNDGHANDNFIYKRVENKEAGYANTLIGLIRDALNSPINTEIQENQIGNFYCRLDPKIQKVFDYIDKEILKIEDDNDSKSANNLTLIDIVTAVMIGRGSSRSFDHNIKELLKKSSNIPKECIPVGAIMHGGKVYRRIYKSSSVQDIVGKTLVVNEEDMKDAIEFGSAKIEKLNSRYLSSFYNIKYVSDKLNFTDPYYNKELSKIILRKEITESEELKRQEEYIDNLTALGKNAESVAKEAITPGGGSFLSNSGSNVLGLKNMAYSYNAVAREMLCFMYASLTKENSNILSTALILAGEADKISKEMDVERIFEQAQSNENYLLAPIFDMITKMFNSEEEDVLENREKKLKETLELIRKSIGEYKIQLADGFITLLGAGVVDKTLTLKSLIDDGNIGAVASWFNKYESIMKSNGSLSTGGLECFRFYAYLSHLCLEDIPNHNVDEINATFGTNSRYQRLYIAAAEDENLWIMHSFYNMVVNNKRGTMARAFPTYYMLLIDEGREFGAWHLQDNFYDISAISEFQVVKSRKIAANTAKIVMSNMFGTFTTDDSDIKATDTHTLRDVWDSVFSPNAYFNKQFNKRENAPELNRANLKPGARIHLRAGYSGSASELPILFNGVVAEINPGDMMTILAQGDGVELDNPSMFIASDAKDAADISQSDNFLSTISKIFNNLSTPKEMLIGPLVSTGGFWRSLTKKYTNSRLFNENPFGIVHFGDVKLNTLHPNGEAEQNIYEGQAYPTWASGGDERSIIQEYEMLEAPKVKVPIHTGTTYWNLMHTAASISPDFIASIDDFGFRSSIFFGQPRYYAAFKYLKDSNGNIIEKRRPFQQYHVINSYHDIISNGMKSSQKNIRTVAVGHYGGSGVLFGTSPKTVGPLFTDIDIYPEYQKSTAVDCGFQYKGTDMPFTIPFFDSAKDEWSSEGGQKIAWRATANALRDFTKDMYSGEILIIGDTIIKPYDMVMISDVYEDINGVVEVETVTHSFSNETGFTTGIVPDCISTIDNTYTTRALNVYHNLVGPITASLSLYVANNFVFRSMTRPLMLGALNKISKGAEATTDVVKSIGKIIGSDQMASFGGLVGDNGMSIMANSIGLTSLDFKISKTLDGLSNTYKKLSSSIKITSGKKASSFIGGYFDDIDMIKGNDAQTLIDDINEALKSTKNKDKRTALLNARNKASSIKYAQDQAIDKLKKTSIKGVDLRTFADDMLKIIPTLDDSIDKDALLKSANNLKSVSGEVISGVDDLSPLLDDVSRLAKHVDDIDNGSISKVIKALKDNKKAVTSQLSMLKNIDIDFKDINLIKKGKSMLSLSLLKGVVGILAQMIIAKTAREFFERKLRNMQVLTVFPVMKDNTVLTSGLNGSKGLVMGSPSYNERGFMDSLAEWAFEDSFFAPILDFFIGTHEIKEVLEKYKRENGFTGSDIGEKQIKIDQLLKEVSAKETERVRPYVALYAELRVLPSKDELAIAGANYAVQNVENIENFNISNSGLQYIFDNETLSFARDKEFVHMNYGVNSRNVILRDMHRSTSGNTVRAKISNKDGKKVWDIPYLRADSKVLLAEIVNRYAQRVQKDYKNIDCLYDKLKANPIYINNASRINDTGWSSTGFTFTIQVKSSKELGNILAEIQKEQDEILESIENKESKLFTYKQSSKSANGYIVYVYPRRV